MNIQATPGTLYAALKNAKGGDVIELEPGSYGLLKIYNFNYAGDQKVLVKSKDPDNRAVFAGVNFNTCSNLIFADVKIKVDPATGFALMIGASSKIIAKDCELFGTQVGDGNAVMARKSNMIGVTGCHIHHLNTGINHLDSNGLEFSGNNIHDLKSDGIRGGGSSDVLIAENDFTDFYPAAGDHPDAIQFWTRNTIASAKNIIIRGNRYLRGKGQQVQGIFIGNENKIPYQFVSVYDNAIVGGMYHGISIGYADQVEVRDNLVVGYVDMHSWIMFNNTTNGKIWDNIATAYQLTDNNVNLDNQRNKQIPTAPIGNLTVYENWERGVEPDPKDILIAEQTALIAEQEAQIKELMEAAAILDAHITELKTKIEAAKSALQ